MSWTTQQLLLRLREEYSCTATVPVGLLACYKVKFAFPYNTNKDLKPSVENRIYFVHDKGKRLDFVNTVMNRRVPT